MTMKRYYRIMLGAKSIHADECYRETFIGGDFGIDTNLSGQLPDIWREFNQKFIPVWLSKNPGKSKVAAGLACGALWTIAKGIQLGDLVICPNGTGSYWVAEVTGNYQYAPDSVLPHRRAVRWYPLTIDRAAMSEALRNSTGSIGTVSDITKYAAEIEAFVSAQRPPTLVSTDDSIEDPVTFALEKHLESFLVSNWPLTDLGKQYDIYAEDGELVGQQYPTDTGPIDILAISKDKKELLVVELKKGRVSDNVVGQIQRYIGYVLETLAEPQQTVKGVIIGLEEDAKIRWALKVAPNIEFYRYQVNFRLFK